MGRHAGDATLPVPKWLRLRVDTWMRRTGLDSQWGKIAIEFLPRIDRGHTGMQVSWSQGYHNGLLQVAKDDYDKLTPAEADQKILHELHHFFTARVSDRLRKLIGNDSFVYKEYSDEEEHCAEQFGNMYRRAFARKQVT